MGNRAKKPARMNERELLVALIDVAREIPPALLIQAKAINAQAGAINHLAQAVYDSMDEAEDEIETQGISEKKGRIIPRAEQ